MLGVLLAHGLHDQRLMSAIEQLFPLGRDGLSTLTVKKPVGALLGCGLS
jgi:hypothetical protein